jgi:hypothetical protein
MRKLVTQQHHQGYIHLGPEIMALEFGQIHNFWCGNTFATWQLCKIFLSLSVGDSIERIIGVILQKFGVEIDNIPILAKNIRPFQLHTL